MLLAFQTSGSIQSPARAARAQWSCSGRALQESLAQPRVVPLFRFSVA